MATIILRNKYKIDALTEGIQLSEAIDGIAYTANINLVETEELKKLGIAKGHNIEVYDIDFETKKNKQVFKGIIWDIDKTRKSKRITITCKERTIYIEESEDEYLFGEGTATQRIQRYCRDWGIPTASLVNTKIKLAKAVYRSDTILGMMLKDLKETAQKGGNLYKLRMLDKLNIIQLGSNKTVWRLETIAEDISFKSSLEGMITQVKILGKQEENKKTPVTGVYKKGTNKYGTMQKLVQDEKIKSGSEAKKRANTLFNTGEETTHISGIDINSIRSGDKVSLNGSLLYIMDVTHNLGSTGRMDLTLSGLDYIRRKFYSGDNI
ncbi:XkdQ [Clostridium sporogenes]|uniref:XkdQ/YqbQ family protein n=1 Tax=Clostridium sporogenes TaxID=1509 RepID=UPI0022372F86|nr:XkdQ [Clostridium sporogenes]MCW6075465.1 XkdQ [Clostridium sporogenes]